MDPSKTDACTQDNGRGAVQLKYAQIDVYRQPLKLSPAVVARAKGLVKQTYGASTSENWAERAFTVACIFIACREKQEEKNLTSMVGRAGVWIQTTIQALWLLEGLLENPPCNQGISIVWKAMSGPCPYSLYPGARLEAKLSWDTHPFVILRGDYSTSSPSFRALRADRVQLVAKFRNNNTVDKDWEMVDWKEEGVADECVTEEVVKAVGWAGALRRGLFG